MKHVFYEVSATDRPLYERLLPGGIYLSEPLTIDTLSHARDATSVSVFIYSHIDADIIQALPHLQLITTRSTGYDHIDLDAARARGITVCNVPEYGTNTVAEHTFALMLALTRRIFPSIMQLKNPDFSHVDLTGVDIYQKTLGVVGLGKIGLRVVQIARGFGMRVLVYNRTARPDLAEQYGYTHVSLDELLAQSDIITLHLSLSSETRHIINRESIERMRRGTYLINTARGGLIQTEALVQGLSSGILEGIALDVLEEEAELTDEIAILSPTYHRDHQLQNLVYNHMLLHHPRVIITPHNAFNSYEALHRIAQTTIDNINAHSSGAPLNTVG